MRSTEEYTEKRRQEEERPVKERENLVRESLVMSVVSGIISIVNALIFCAMMVGFWGWTADTTQKGMMMIATAAAFFIFLINFSSWVEHRSRK